MKVPAPEPTSAARIGPFCIRLLSTHQRVTASDAGARQPWPRSPIICTSVTACDTLCAKPRGWNPSSTAT
eukprot:4766403-Prymnesium_polylepis.1